LGCGSKDPDGMAAFGCQGAEKKKRGGKKRGSQPLGLKKGGLRKIVLCEKEADSGTAKDSRNRSGKSLAILPHHPEAGGMGEK